MTDNEIIKAFKDFLVIQEDGYITCLEYGGKRDEYFEKDFGLLGNVFDLINRQKAEIERLRDVVEKTDAAYYQKVDEINRLKAENEHLQDLLVKTNNDIAKQESNIEQLKKELKTIRAYIHDNGLEWDLLSKHKKESKCDCYHTEEKTIYRYDQITGAPIPHKKTVGVCWGTKECEECSCNGNENKCDFYPKKRNGR